MSEADKPEPEAPVEAPTATGTEPRPQRPVVQPPGERGGPKGAEPTRFGDWEKDGRCFDF